MAAAPRPPEGWMIAVLMETPDVAGFASHYFAVAKPDQARAEWAAVDRAVEQGRVAMSPIGGDEPVRAIAPLSAATLKQNGMRAGEARALGRRRPRRWLGA